MNRVEKVFFFDILLNMEKTVCAISTSLGNSAISIIRITGKDSLKIARKYFSSKGLNYEKVMPRHVYLGEFDLDKNKEKCLMIYFKGPNSYTGEDLVEFQIHGGEFLAKKILAVLIKECELATPGEFSKRAFLNGKLSLSEAEGIVDVINAESEAELSSAYSLSTGRFNKKIAEFQSTLTEIIAQIEVALDYPEHDEEFITLNQAKEKVKDIRKETDKLIKNSETGLKIKSGLNAVIVGSPNVGKSSLLNALLEKDRAIVSSIPGTTRDTLSETIEFEGIKFNLTDTAGIREQGDEIEKIGIERAKKEVSKADIVLFVIDLERELTGEEEAFLKKLDADRTLIVFNKIDKKKKDIKLKNFSNFVEISALKEINIDGLKQKIYDMTIKNKVDLSKIVLTNMRHINILKEIREQIDRMLQEYEMPFDAFAFQIRSLWEAFGKITGETENEKIINEIFSRFCLGK